jgi:glycosyltransferase involved in cell wall biosynthesis
MGIIVGGKGALGMKILRVIASVHPAQGGPIAGLRASALLHRAMGHETEIVSLDPPNGDHVTAFPFKVHALGPVPRRYGYTPRLGQWFSAHADRFDVAVVHGLWNHAVVGGGHALIRAKVPYVVFTHGMMDPWFRGAYPVKHLAKQLFWWGLQGRVLAGAGRVLFTSQEEMRLAGGAFRGHRHRREVIAYGAAAPGPSDLASGVAAMRAACPALGDAPYLLFLGRIHAKKGADILIDAFCAIAAARPDLHLVIAGPDETGLAAGLAARATAHGFGARAHFPGLLTGSAKWGAFLGAEAFVLPSHQENFGIAVAEALACGRPVIVSDKVNIWREVEAAGAGIVAPDTVAGFRSALARWAGCGPEQRAAMATATQACYQRHFRPETAAAALARLLEEVAHG